MRNKVGRNKKVVNEGAREDGRVENETQYTARLQRYYRRLSAEVKDVNLPTFTDTQLEQFMGELTALVQSHTAKPASTKAA